MRGAMWFAGWLLVGALAFGCAAAPAPRASDPASAAPSSPPAAAESGDSGDPAGSAPAGPRVVNNGPLAPGSYASTSVGVTIQFEIAEAGWQGAEDLPGVGLALLRDGIEGGVTITHFPGEVYSNPCSGDASEPLDASADAFVAWLADHPELDAQPPVETTLGGHPSLQLDVDAAVGEECPDSPRIWLWVLPVVGDFHLDEGEAARFIVGDVGDRTVVVVVETYDPADFEPLLGAVEPVLASLTIEP